MKGHVNRGGGFRGVVNYLLTTEEAKGRRTMRAGAAVIGGNLSGRSPREIAAEFGESRRLRPGVRRPVWHCSLSLPAGERLTDAEWQDVAGGLLRKVGLDPDRHPHLLVRHMDTDYEHVHLVASRISVGGELWHGKWEAHQVMQATGELEVEHGLALTTQFDPELHRERRNLTTGQVQEALRLERVPTKLVLQQILDQALVDTPTTAAFLERLDAAGVDALPNIASTGRMSGFSFSLQETGEVFKASQLGAAYSWKRLQERLDYGQSRDVEVLRAQVVEVARRADLRAAGVAGGEPGAHVGADRTAGAGHGQADGRVQGGLGGDASAVHGASQGLEPAHGRGAGEAENGHGSDRGPSRGTDAGHRVSEDRDVDSQEDSGTSPGHDAGRQAPDGVGGRGQRSGLWDNHIRRIVDLAQMGVSMADRTRTAVAHQLKAFGCELFDVGPEGEKGLWGKFDKTAQEVLDMIPWLKRQNAQGENVYIRPARSQQEPLVFLDDISLATIDRMGKDGLPPAVVVESSPGNYQAWVRVQDDGAKLSEAVRKAVSVELCRMYGGDAGSRDAVHWGRLAGFTNRKPHHVSRDGLFPYATLTRRTGKTAPAGPRLVVDVGTRLAEANERSRQAALVDSLRQTRSAFDDTDPWWFYEQCLAHLKGDFGQDYDRSRADWIIATYLLERGHALATVAQVIADLSEDLQDRKTAHVADYVVRTVGKADVWRELKAKGERYEDVSGQLLELAQDRCVAIQGAMERGEVVAERPRAVHEQGWEMEM